MKSKRPLAVITGGASGIGLAAVERFLREGYRVAVLDRVPLPPRRNLHFYKCDLLQLSKLDSLCPRIVRELGPVRVLVNNAGMYISKPVTDLTADDWLRGLQLNLVAAAALARGFVPSMKGVRRAAIVNVSSRNALSSSPRASVYDSAKAGLLAFTRTLAVELGEFGIRANAVCPGVTRTALTESFFKDPKFVENYRKLIPLNDFGRPEDIANVIYFLASDEARFVTGQYLVVDGGQLAGQNFARIFA